jgi:hypothetical protein
MARYRTWFKFESRWWLAVIAFAALVVWSRQIHQGGFTWSDAPIHAMDGVFLLDASKASPAGQFQDWADAYYLRYPCLGLVVLYPPFFAAVEAVFYAFCGVSAVTARACVIFFGLGGLLAMYWVARQLFDHRGGILAAGLWASLPTTVLWARDVMLEIPTAAMLLACLGAYLQYQSGRSRRWLILTAVLLVAAVLTRHWAIFLGIVLVLDAATTLGWKKILTSEHGLVFGAALIVIGLYLLFSARFIDLGRLLVRPDGGWRHLLRPGTWLFYPRTMPEVVGWPMLGFAAVGFLITASVGQVKRTRLPVLWMAVFYFFASAMAYKEPRYFYLITPPVVLLAVGGLYHALDKTPLKTAGRSILGLALVLQMIFGWRQDPDRLSDYRPAAQAILRRDDSRLVLVDGVRDGQFVFDMRRLQGPGGMVFTLRGSRLLGFPAVQSAGLGPMPIQSEKDILSLIRKYGIRYVVVENNPPAASVWQNFYPHPSYLLRETLQNPAVFERLADFPIGSGPAWKDVRLILYRYRGRMPVAARSVLIPVPSIGREVEISLPER